MDLHIQRAGRSSSKRWSLLQELRVDCDASFYTKENQSQVAMDWCEISLIGKVNASGRINKKKISRCQAKQESKRIILCKKNKRDIEE